MTFDIKTLGPYLSYGSLAFDRTYNVAEKMALEIRMSSFGINKLNNFG